MSNKGTWLAEIGHTAATWIELFGISAIIIGGVIATAVFFRNWWRQETREGAYHAYRSQFGRAILLGLELLVAADIIGTVAVEPSFRSLGVLGLIVLIRTFLSFSLEVEINGRWPWQQRSGH